MVNNPETTVCVCEWSSVCSGGTVSLQLHMTVIMLHLPVDLQVLTLQGEKRGVWGGCLVGTQVLTCSTAGAALSVWNCSVGTGDQWAGDLAAHRSRVLQKNRSLVSTNFNKSFHESHVGH